MDAANGSASSSLMIALLPESSEWCTLDLPHMTLVYGGDVSELQPSAFNEIAKDTAMLAMLSRTMDLRVLGREEFGPDGEKVEVYRLQATPELLAMRRAVEQWNASEFAFNPHVTIGPVGAYVSMPPSRIYFNKIMVGWGDDRLTWFLR